jgi:hypothetical protein
VATLSAKSRLMAGKAKASVSLAPASIAVEAEKVAESPAAQE